MSKSQSPERVTEGKRQTERRRPEKNLTIAAALSPGWPPTEALSVGLRGVILTLLGQFPGPPGGTLIPRVRLFSLITSCSSLSPPQDFSPHSSPSLTPFQAGTCVKKNKNKTQNTTTMSGLQIQQAKYRASISGEQELPLTSPR